MNHPQYLRTYWTEERRKAASDRAKARWAEKRQRENAEWERRRASPIGRVQDRLRAEHQRMEAARAEYFRAKTVIEELEKARAALETADAILVAQGLTPLGPLDGGGERRSVVAW